MTRVLFLAPLVALVSVPVYLVFLKPAPPLPDMDLNAWWGPDSLKAKQDTSVRDFKVKFEATMIKDLKERLNNHRDWTPPLQGVGFSYGFNSAALNKWLQYWSESYNFSKRQDFLNQFPHYKTNIQGLDIHFIRVTPKVPSGVKVVPMLLLHGWPGSVREFYEAIPYLTAVTKDRDFALEVIVPSLPGYGFSDPAVRPGLGAAEMAVVLRNLMQRIGFEKYYVQGGDWGSLIGSNIATLFPEEVLGYHSNLPFVMNPMSTLIQFLASVYPTALVKSEFVHKMYPFSTFFKDLLEETGYMHIQSTKPDTVGMALSDSPSGLLAYILEKFSTWTNKSNKGLNDGGLEKKFSKDQLIDNLMMYWSSNSITTSVRLYSETFNSNQQALRLNEIPTNVPTWVLQAMNEISYQPPALLKLFKYKNLLGETTFNDGGHFLAFEMPKEYSKDVLNAVEIFRKWHQSNAKTEL